MTIATSFLVPHCTTSSQIQEDKNQRSPRKEYCTQLIPLKHSLSYPCLCSHVNNHGRIFSSLQYIIACASSSTPLTSSMSTRLYVSGLSFRTTRESLQNAFQKFGELVEVNLVMDKIANRPRGFAFLRYETEEEAKNAIEGMHGKFLDGRVIFVEVAKPRSESGKNLHNSRNSQR